jgi:TatD DNase family protein
LDDERFVADLAEVIERAEAAGITKINCVATDLESSRQVIALSERFPNVYAVVGWHPSYAMDAPEDVRPALRELARHPKVVALGETGLDYYRLPSKAQKESPAADQKYKAKQAELFRQHLELAAETGLGVVVHERESMEDLLSQVEPFAGKVRAVFPLFCGNGGGDGARV